MQGASVRGTLRMRPFDSPDVGAVSQPAGALGRSGDARAGSRHGSAPAGRAESRQGARSGRGRSPVRKRALKADRGPKTASKVGAAKSCARLGLEYPKDEILRGLEFLVLVPFRSLRSLLKIRAGPFGEGGNPGQSSQIGNQSPRSALVHIKC
jgi:hypothetical protein